MSASLVGSEMCIRDRRQERALSSFSRSISRGGLPPPPPPDLHERGLPEPVSYTHLTLPTICSV
eukprot:5445503-Alexandrium_andersonii.AAC.1